MKLKGRASKRSPALLSRWGQHLWETALGPHSWVSWAQTIGPHPGLGEYGGRESEDDAWGGVRVAPKRLGSKFPKL